MGILHRRLQRLRYKNYLMFALSERNKKSEILQITNLDTDTDDCKYSINIAKGTTDPRIDFMLAK